ncbi:hypothetical protein EVAR_32263_1 [Eumeta japonica]|uniref:Uncharacterized protein n=1 Tax=Eumeta variegata TaxID=151549 RepID=A0A4C1WZQ5_EUMVA|nr:hypothetical protein EVAR_32263_1 [Eumeta japonica]
MERGTSMEGVRYRNAWSPGLHLVHYHRHYRIFSTTTTTHKLCRSELPAMHMFIAPRPFPLLPRLPVLRPCDTFVINFTAAEFWLVCLVGTVLLS